MSVLIVGGKGNMGKRYGSILSYLGVESSVADLDTSEADMRLMAAVSTGIIIATPTDTHCNYIRMFSAHGVPILCEKPFTKNMAELSETLTQCRSDRTKLNMVYQYKVISESLSRRNAGQDWTYYNYFKHGSDGLVWDCIQLIGLAKGRVDLQEDSPLWRCRINGSHLDIGYMDAAYVHFVRQWMKSPGQDLGEIGHIHHKTEDYARKHAV